MKSGIYSIINILHCKAYVGCAKDIKNRWRQHRNALNADCHNNPHLQSSWSRYGEKSFVFEVLEYCAEPELEEREQFWINKLDAFNNGYNLRPNAYNNIGKKHSNVSRQNMSRAHIGIKQTLESRKKRSATMKARKISESSMIALSRYRGDRRNKLKWSCAAGIRCKCEKCLTKKREYGVLWARKKADEKRIINAFAISEIDDCWRNVCVITMPMDKWDVIKDLLKL